MIEIEGFVKALDLMGTFVFAISGAASGGMTSFVPTQGARCKGAMVRPASMTSKPSSRPVRASKPKLIPPAFKRIMSNTRP